MQVPEGWEKLSFGEVVSIKTKKFNPKKETMVLPCIELEHIDQETGRLLGSIPSAQISSMKSMFNRGDVLFGKLRPYLKKFAQPNFNGICSTEIWVLKNNKQLEKSYLFYLIQTNRFLYEANKSTGSKMPRADWEIVEQHVICLPPLPEQTKIAEILSTWDNAITTTEQLLANSQQQKKALMQQLLTGKKRLLDDNGQRFTGKWKVTSFDSLFSKISNGLTYDTKKTDGLPVTRIETISTGQIDFKKVGWAPNDDVTKRFKLNKGDILYSHINSLEHIGRVVYFDDSRDLYHGMNLLLLRAKSNCCSKFMYYLLNSEIGKKYAKTYAKNAVNQASISTTDIKTFKVAMPVLSEQQKIAAVLTAADDEIRTLEQKIDQLKQEKKALMQQLLTGKRRVQTN